MEVPQKIKYRTTIGSSSSTPGYISKKAKTLNQKDTLNPMFTAALFTIAKIWRQHKCPSTDEWIKKTYTRILFSHKKEGNLAICDNTNGPSGHYAK